MAHDFKRIASWLQPSGILLDMDVRDRHEALEVVSTAIARDHGLEQPPVFRALWRREQVGSTGRGGGSRSRTRG